MLTVDNTLDTKMCRRKCECKQNTRDDVDLDLD